MPQQTLTHLSCSISGDVILRDMLREERREGRRAKKVRVRGKGGRKSSGSVSHLTHFRRALLTSKADPPPLQVDASDREP